MSLRLSSNSITEVTGTYTFPFALTPILNESQLITSIQVQSMATSLPLNLHCKWYRIKDERSIFLSEITGK